MPRKTLTSGHDVSSQHQFALLDITQVAYAAQDTDVGAFSLLFLLTFFAPKDGFSFPCTFKLLH